MRPSPVIEGSGRQTAGFTMVELAVSMSILAILLILLVEVFNATTSAWISSEGGNERRRSARSLTDFMGSELRGAMLPVEITAKATQANLQMLINPPAGSVPPVYQNPHSIFWQAPLATERTLGDVAELGYFVKWDQHGNDATPTLRRFFVNPTRLETGQTAYSANPNFRIYTSLDSWLSADLLEAVAPATKATGYAGLFAENVVGLWIRYYGLGGREITVSAKSTMLATSFDSRKGYEYKFSKDPNDPSGQDKVELRYLPLSVSISIAQLDSHYALRLGGAWQKVQTLANDVNCRDGAGFLRAYREAAKTDGQLRGLLPGLRIYSTNVILDNGR